MLDVAQAAERLRPSVKPEVHPGPLHWASLRVTLFQHCLWTDPDYQFDRVFSAKALHEFAYTIPSAPLFHPSPLPSVKHDKLCVLVHKIIPNRCQLRSLIDTISHAMHSNHPACRRFLSVSVMCSLLGLYPGSTPAPLPARRALLAAYAVEGHSRRDVMPAENIVSTLLRMRCQQTLFFALKETLVYLVNRCNHTVMKCLQDYHGWDAFCRLVTSAMNRARSLLRGERGDLDVFERSLAHVSKQRIRRLFSRQPQSRDFEAALLLECEKFFEQSSTRYRSRHWHAFQKMALRVPDTAVPLHWMQDFAAWFAHRPGESPDVIANRTQRFCALVPELQDARAAYFADGSKTKLRAALTRAGSWDDLLCDVASLAEVFRDKRYVVSQIVSLFFLLHLTSTSAPHTSCVFRFTLR